MEKEWERETLEAWNLKNSLTDRRHRANLHSKWSRKLNVSNDRMK